MKLLTLFVLFCGLAFSQSPPVNATQLRGRNISTAAPSLNQIYKWNGTAWTPATIAGAGTVTSVVIAGTANKITVSGTCTITATGTCTITIPTGVILVAPALGTPASGVMTNVTGIPPGAVTSAQGNGTKFQFSTGSTTEDNCVKFDANGNTVDSGTTCGTGGSGVTSVVIAGTANKITVSGTCTITTTGTCTITIPDTPTLVTPTIASFVNATHGHTNAAGGGQLTITTASNATGTPSSSTFLRGDNTWSTPAGAGDVVGPGSATDNAIVRFDSTTGKLIQNSVVTIADTTGDMSSPGNAAFGVGGSVGGALGLGQGTATTAATGIAGFMAPASVTTPYYMILPAAPTTGFLLNTGTTDPSTISIVGSSGTGNVVRVTSATLVTPTLGVATATSYNGLTLTSTTGTFTLTNGKTFAVTHGLTLSGTDSTVMTFPTTTATIARTDAAQTFTGVQTFSSAPVLSLASATANTLPLTAIADSLITPAKLAVADFTTPGTTKTFSLNSGYFECTGTCTITMPVPAAGQQYCVRNANNVATVITFAAIGSSARYEATAKTSYGTAGTGTLVSGGTALDQMCLVGKDSTHFDIFSYAGTWTAN